VRLADRTDQQFISGRPKDLAEELGADGIRTILIIICEAYKILLILGKVESAMNETRITEELFIELQAVMRTGEYRNLSLYPIHEKSHDRNGKGRGKTPTIDFCFRDRWVRDRYFGAECKLLKENYKTLYDDYVAGGVCRYLTGKYSENCSIGSMIGYITSGNTGEIINITNPCIKEKLIFLFSTYIIYSFLLPESCNEHVWDNHTHPPSRR